MNTSLSVAFYKHFSYNMNVYLHRGWVFMIITFCGHSNYLYNNNVEQRLISLIHDVSKGEAVSFYLGGYGNFDILALKCAKSYKLYQPNSKLIFVTPYINKWLNDRKELLLKNYDEIIYPEIETTPLKYAITKRNEWMVNKSDILICYVNTHYGGAYKTLLYAHSRNKSYVNLYTGNYTIY